METVLAEKIETILSRNVTNTRARDFYDIHLLYKIKEKEINWFHLKEALVATSTKRESLDELNDWENIIKDIKESEIVLLSWQRYQLDNHYANTIELTNIFETLEVYFSNIINFF